MNGTRLTTGGFREAVNPYQRGIANGVDQPISWSCLRCNCRGGLCLPLAGRILRVVLTEEVREEDHGNRDGGENGACGSNSHRRHGNRNGAEGGTTAESGVASIGCSRFLLPTLLPKSYLMFLLFLVTLFIFIFIIF